MSGLDNAGILQAMIAIGLALLLAFPLGAYVARVMESGPAPLDRLLGPLERAMLAATGRATRQYGWRG